MDKRETVVEVFCSECKFYTQSRSYRPAFNDRCSANPTRVTDWFEEAKIFSLCKAKNCSNSCKDFVKNESVVKRFLNLVKEIIVEIKLGFTKNNF